MKSILRSCPLIYLIVLKLTGGNASPNLLVTNNGPSVFGANVSFTASLSNYDKTHELVYSFNDGVRTEDYPSKAHNMTIRRAFSENEYEEQCYFMNVTIKNKELLFFDVEVASNFTKFCVQSDLIGEIVLEHQNNSNALDIDEVAVGKNISFSVKLYDPEDYLKDAAISYSWSVDWERHQTLNDTLVYNFTDAGVKHLQAIATASLPNNIYLSGIFEKIVNAKVPVNSLNVSGNFFMHHGETLNLNITCNGSPPFIYCYKIMRDNNTTENFTCSHLSTFTTCHMEIIKYFQNDGKFNIGIYVSNNVQEIRRVLEVMVYSVSVSPTLSTVIIPIVCSLLTLAIIAGGIAYFIQQKNQLAVEVANFDFQDESDSYTERTFFEKIFDSFTCRGCTSPRLSCSVQSETDPLI